MTLNTPGEQDGGFVLAVDGQEVMRRMDVFYRDVPSVAPPPEDDGPSEDTPLSPLPVPPPTTPTLPPPQALPLPPPAAQSSASGILGILNPFGLYRNISSRSGSIREGASLGPRQAMPQDTNATVGPSPVVSTTWIAYTTVTATPAAQTTTVQTTTTTLATVKAIA